MPSSPSSQQRIQHLEPANGSPVELTFDPDTLAHLAQLLGRAEARRLAADLQNVAANP